MTGFLRSLFGKKEKQAPAAPDFSLKDSILAEYRRGVQARQEAIRNTAESLLPEVIQSLRKMASEGVGEYTYGVSPRVQQDHREAVADEVAERLWDQGFKAWSDGRYVTIQIEETDDRDRSRTDLDGTEL